MNSKDIFKVWAPINTKWIDWVRPVPFVWINGLSNNYNIHNFTVTKVHYITELKTDVAIFIDMPEYKSIEEGIFLAGLGFRPIPLYNGTNEQFGAMALVDNHTIASALIWGAKELETIKINNDAPPVFLLDSNRMHRFKNNSSIFDNSWDLYDQDIPSPDYFINNGINKIIIRGNIVNKDLRKILYKFQNKGITILFTEGYEEPKKVILKRPSSKEK